MALKVMFDTSLNCFRYHSGNVESVGIDVLFYTKLHCVGVVKNRCVATSLEIVGRK